jgi:uncharacterized protein YktA (UPF0223 family)
MNVDIPVIKKTTNYSDFKTVTGNRLLNKKHYKTLLQAINERNLLALNPIIVNNNMEVIDGQHRLQVAKTLNIPIYYVKGNGLNYQDVVMFNNTMRSWTMEDYARGYIALGFKEYAALERFKNKWHFSMSNAMAILSGDGQVHKAIYSKFKHGLFEVANLDWANEFAQKLHDVVPFTSENTWKDRDFIRALSILYDKGIDHGTLVERLSRFGSVIYRRANVTDYLRTFEDIYNQGVRPNNVQRFY